MRIVSVALFAGFLLGLSGQVIDSPQNSVGYVPDIDPIITGRTITKQHELRWQAEHERYLECPECVASQPFPGD